MGPGPGVGDPCANGYLKIQYKQKDTCCLFFPQKMNNKRMNKTDIRYDKRSVFGNRADYFQIYVCFSGRVAVFTKVEFL